MEPEKINKRPRFIVRWSPVFFALATAWAFLSWRYHPVPILYILACVAIGLFCGALIIADFTKNFSPLLYALWFMVFISGEMFLKAFFFPNLDPDSRKMSYQYLSVVLASVLGLVVILRHRILKYYAEHDAKQLVGPDRRERVL